MTSIFLNFKMLAIDNKSSINWKNTSIMINEKYFKEVVIMFFRTDMAIERRDIFRKANKLETEIPGIECNEENLENMKITRVEIKTKEGEEALNKKIGNYVTIDLKKIIGIY